MVQKKFPNLKYLDNELFLHQNYSYSLSKTNHGKSINSEGVYKISISEYNEMTKRIDEYKSRIESLEEIIKIQDANNTNNNNNLLNKWREKVFQLLIDNKLNERIKNREITRLKEENKQLKKEKEYIEKDIKNSMNMFYHSFSDIYRQIMLSSDSLITKCNTKIHQLTEMIDININPLFERISTENYGFEETIDNLMKENEELKLHINQYQIELESLTNEFNRKEKDLNSQIDKINEVYRIEKSSYREKDRKNEELENKISELESENEMLKNRIDRFGIEKQSVDIKMKEYEKKIQKLEKENKDLIREGIRLTNLFNKKNCAKQEINNNNSNNNNDDNNKESDGSGCNDDDSVKRISSDSSSDSDNDNYILNRRKNLNYKNKLKKEDEKRVKQEKSTNSIKNKYLSREEELKLISNMMKIINKS